MTATTESAVNSSEKPKMVFVWRTIIGLTLFHYWAIRIFFSDLKLDSFLFHFCYGMICAFGIVAGSHRLWAHRSYKANYGLQVFLMITQAVCMQNDIIEWVRDHRVHHKYSDTNADPHSSARGLFFSHMGWLMCKKHPDVRSYGKKVDISDVENDPLLQFQRKYYYVIIAIFAFIVPIYISMYVFNTSFWTSYYACFTRHVIQLNLVFATNSASHWGSWKPYDKNIAASDSHFFGTILFGEGWHNYHHTFPWDYRLSEHAKYYSNWGRLFIDTFAKIGWVTELKVASDEMIRKRVIRTGDGTHSYSKMKHKYDDDDNNNEVIRKGVESYWGCGDSDIPDEDVRDIETITKI